MHNTPTKKTGKPLAVPKEVRKGHWIDMNFGPANHLKKATELLSSCDVDPNTVRIRFD